MYTPKFSGDGNSFTTDFESAIETMRSIRCIDRGLQVTHLATDWVQVTNYLPESFINGCYKAFEVRKPVIEVNTSVLLNPAKLVVFKEVAKLHGYEQDLTTRDFGQCFIPVNLSENKE